ncbi:MAG: haloalkane dehalogenase [Chloroflexi bacterium]|nr:haloalkane dehalogenase [Chloroflexota bacterium]MBV9131347.1 haloalkane dehalogenase [Chloroflexota bacterium]MBV9893674.1 haloalkane dehalogenase [Chloroflexota bacterium]
MPSSATLPKQYQDVLGRRMAYVERGAGDPIVLLHGNPTSSYLWRNIIPYLEGLGRCIAPDLIGMGDSDKLPNSGPTSYSFVEHRRYLGALLDQLGVRERVTFVIHDWGSALGFDWAYRHQTAVKAIAYMEALVRPLSWADLGEARPMFEMLRSPAGDAMILEQNVFVEQAVPGSILRRLDDAEMAEYRRPYLEPGESRRPTLTWPRQIPLDGEPADVHTIVQDYSTWLSQSPIPKLFVKGEPGAILSKGPFVDFCRSWPNQKEVSVPGIHYLQEDSSDAIGQFISDWLRSLS